MTSSIRTLLPMAADGIGPSYTCTRLVQGALQAGADIDLMVNRFRMPGQHSKIHAALSGPLAHIPYKYIHGPATRRLERQYLSRLEAEDIAWLWPSVSLDIHKAVHARSIPIVLEGINTRMASAKNILDAAYDDFGAPAAHGITDRRIAEEEQKIALATTIFAPSPDVEAALKGSALENRFIPSSYGVDTSEAPPFRPPRSKSQVTFVFCGYTCVRKGAHHLLDVWPLMPKNARLRLVGRIEPIIAERYADLLASESVEVIGFTRQVSSHYAAADVFVFPSLEEGDPLVTYEAAHHGLPLVTSTAGGGRIGAENECCMMVDPKNRSAFLATLMTLYDSQDTRLEWGEKARLAVAKYDWSRVGANRIFALRNALAR